MAARRQLLYTAPAAALVAAATTTTTTTAATAAAATATAPIARQQQRRRRRPECRRGRSEPLCAPFGSGSGADGPRPLCCRLSSPARVCRGGGGGSGSRSIGGRRPRIGPRGAMRSAAAAAHAALASIWHWRLVQFCLRFAQTGSARLTSGARAHGDKCSVALLLNRPAEHATSRPLVCQRAPSVVARCGRCVRVGVASRRGPSHLRAGSRRRRTCVACKQAAAPSRAEPSGRSCARQS